MTTSERLATEEVLNAVVSLQKSFDVRHTENVDRLTSIEEMVEKLMNGFPNRDPDSHRRYHEAIIARMELRNKLVREALTKAAGAGAIAGTGWIAYAIWQALKFSIKAA